MNVDLIETNSVVIAKGQEGIVISAAKGWYKVEIDGEIKSFRAKDISVATSAVMDTPPAPPAVDGDIDLVCPEDNGGCGHTLIVPADKVNIQCPLCGTWMKVRLSHDKERYHRGLGTTPGGNPTYDVNDLVAIDLRGLDYEAMVNIAADQFLLHPQEVALSKKMAKEYDSEDWSRDTIYTFIYNRYEDRNNGMQRMNIGNLLRQLRNRIDNPATSYKAEYRASDGYSKKKICKSKKDMIEWIDHWVGANGITEDNLKTYGSRASYDGVGIVEWSQI